MKGKLPAEFREWMKWDSSAKKTENGEVSFLYMQLAQLKNGLVLKTGD
jgi:hypothetical protein